MSQKQIDYEHRALLYAEKYGIIDYTVKNNIMTYTESFLLENRSIQAEVNLDTNKEKRTQIGNIQ